MPTPAAGVTFCHPPSPAPVAAPIRSSAESGEWKGCFFPLVFLSSSLPPRCHTITTEQEANWQERVWEMSVTGVQPEGRVERRALMIGRGGNRVLSATTVLWRSTLVGNECHSAHKNTDILDTSILYM